VGDKMTCPGCGAHTSNVLAAVCNGEPCPYCGLSADAIGEISDVRRKRADEELKERLEKALTERDRALSEAAKHRQAVEDARRALGCTHPYAPHTAPGWGDETP